MSDHVGNDLDQRLSRLEAVVSGLAESVNALTNDVRNIITGKPTNWGWIISAASLAIVTLALVVAPIYRDILNLQQSEYQSLQRWVEHYEWKGSMQKSMEDAEKELHYTRSKINDLDKMQSDRFTSKEGDRMQKQLDEISAEQRRRTSKVYDG